MTPPNPQDQIKRLREALEGLLKTSADFYEKSDEIISRDESDWIYGSACKAISALNESAAEARAALADVPSEAVETRKEWRMASAYGEAATLQDEDLARFRFERYHADDPGVWLESRTLTITATPWTREESR